MESFTSLTRLAPGLRVVRRGPRHLQVGLYAGRRVLLPRTPVVERTLRAVLGQGELSGDDPETTAVLQRLDDGGCLATTSAAAPVAPTVSVVGRFEDPGLPDVAGLLRSGGCSVSCRPHAGAASLEGVPAADVVLLLRAGELAREELDGLVRQQTSHLVVRLVDGGAVLGPFVVPGVTACLRCVDAHESLGDPDHVAVTTRYVRATSRARCDGVPDTAPAVAALAVAWAVRDVLAHLNGTEPSTWSRTLTISARSTDVRRQAWSRHPQCGCSWPAELVSPRGYADCPR